MRANFRADAVFERRNNFPARRVVFGIRGENKQHVQRQPQRIAFNLYIALLHDVEEANLNFSCEIRQFVDGEDTAIRARQKAIVDRQLVGKIAAAASCSNRVHIADNIGDRHVRRG